MLFSFTDFVALLRCPTCLGALTYRPTPSPEVLKGDYGVLKCRCYSYPVLGSIPVLYQHPVNVNSIGVRNVEVGGPHPLDLVALLENGEALAALLELLAFPLCPWPLNKVSWGRKLSQREPFRNAGIRWRKRRLKQQLQLDTFSAEDWLTLFCWHSPVRFDAYNYLFFRFGQPRHLATLSLLSILPPSEKPLLDLACGYGHLLHYLTARESPQAAVGLDHNFHQVWVAKQRIAPGAHFVCADADAPLPFKNGVFSAALCCDAFHYLRNQPSCISELGRTTAKGTIILARVGNQAIPPNEGYERSAAGYATLMEGWNLRILSETGLVDSYLAARGPQLASAPTPEQLAAEKWLYFVATHNEAMFGDYGVFTSWPHAAGVPQLNPIYDRYAGPRQARLKFRFPSPWYAFENARMASYHLEELVLEPNDYETLDKSLASERLEPLLKAFVLLGLPRNYVSPTRPWAFYANRALTQLLSRLRHARG